MYTTKTAIIIGGILFVAAGIAIGATIVANFIDVNSLTQYRDNPKLTQWVTLNDDADGQRAGWNPIVGQQQGNLAGELPVTKYERLFTILDSDVKVGDTVLAFVIQPVRVEAQNDRGETLEPVVLDMPCMTRALDGGFTVYCDGNDIPQNGSQLKYIVLAQQ